MKNYSYIYEIENLVTHETYIGQRKVPIEYYDNPTLDTYMGSGNMLIGAGNYKGNGIFKRYGKENFKKTIICLGYFSPEELAKLEVFFISEFKKIGKANYNISSGGKQCMTGHHHSEESKQKSRESNIRTRLLNPKINENMIKHRKNEGHAPLSDQHRKKLSQYFTGKTYEDLMDEETAKEARRKKSLPRPYRQGLKWFNNGTENFLRKECPEGCVPGLLTKGFKIKPKESLLVPL